MANYIYNYIECSKEAADKLIDELNSGELIPHRLYYYIERKLINNGKEIIVMDTKASFDDDYNVKYDDELINKFINENHDVKWMCIEENLVEEALFCYFDGKVQCLKRDLKQDNDSILCCYDYDYNLRPFEIMFLYNDGRVCKEDIIRNKCIEVSIPDEMLVEIWKKLIDYYRILEKNFYVIEVNKDEPHKEFMICRDNKHFTELISSDIGEFENGIDGTDIGNELIRLINKTIGTVNEEFVINEIVK